jgi:5-methylcytosine-specific restriction protein A
VVVLDARASKLGNFVPERFAANWSARQVFEEGARQELVLSAAERDPGLRKAALKHYGTTCQHAGCDVSQAHLLDVHHLHPVSEGVRRTTLKDVTVLCANHHRQAHFEMKMIQTLTMDAIPVLAVK